LKIIELYFKPIKKVKVSIKFPLYQNYPLEQMGENMYNTGKKIETL